MILNNLSEIRVARFRQLAKPCATFARTPALRLEVLLRLGSLMGSRLERRTAPLSSKCASKLPFLNNFPP